MIGNTIYTYLTNRTDLITALGSADKIYYSTIPKSIKDGMSYISTSLPTRDDDGCIYTQELQFNVIKKGRENIVSIEKALTESLDLQDEIQQQDNTENTDFKLLWTKLLSSDENILILNKTKTILQTFIFQIRFLKK